MSLKIVLTFILIIFNLSAFAINVRVLDFQQITENNTNLSLLYDQIEKDQASYKEIFKNEELILQNDLKRIEELNLILEPIELETSIKELHNIFVKSPADAILDHTIYAKLAELKSRMNKNSPSPS